MDKGVQEEVIREDADEEGVGSHNRYERKVHTKKRKGIPIVERRERGDKRICERAVAKGVYMAVKVTANGAGILCGKKGWKEADGAEL